MLAAERVALNFLTHLCGVATQSRRFAQAVAGTGATVVDTRKTTAGLRYWEKRAVRHGGCGNHRFGLFDLVLIKDNHLAAAGGVAAAVTAARAAAPFGMRVEVEVEGEAGLIEALTAGADIILLDNMTLAELRRSVATARRLSADVVLEASGGVTLGDGARHRRDRRRRHLVGVADLGGSARRSGAGLRMNAARRQARRWRACPGGRRRPGRRPCSW